MYEEVTVMSVLGEVSSVPCFAFRLLCWGIRGPRFFCKGLGKGHPLKGLA